RMLFNFVPDKIVGLSVTSPVCYIADYSDILPWNRMCSSRTLFRPSMGSTPAGPAWCACCSILFPTKLSASLPPLLFATSQITQTSCHGIECALLAHYSAHPWAPPLRGQHGARAVQFCSRQNCRPLCHLSCLLHRRLLR